MTGNGASCVDEAEPNSPAASEWMLPEMLPGHLSALVGKWHLGASPLGRRWECAALDQGFDRWLEGSAANVQSCAGQNYTNWMRVELCRARMSGEYEPLAVAEAARSFLGEAGGPKLTIVCPNLAHEPFHRPPEELLPAGYPPTSDTRSRYEAMLVALDGLLARISRRSTSSRRSFSWSGTTALHRTSRPIRRARRRPPSSAESACRWSRLAAPCSLVDAARSA